METILLGPYDYDSLQSCPFCGGFCISPIDPCPHFVTAFEDGIWRRNLLPPVFCDGFRYEREKLLAALSHAKNIVCYMKPITNGHPSVEAYFCADVRGAAELRNIARKVPCSGGAKCGECGQQLWILNELDHAICYFCGPDSLMTLDLDDNDEK